MTPQVLPVISFSRSPAPSRSPASPGWWLPGGGAAAGLLFAILFYRGNIITGTTDVVRVFYTALAVIIGILIGRIAAARLAVKKLQELHAILYRDTKPQECIRLLEAGSRALQGAAEQEDMKYLEEECSLSSNLIHKKEMQLLIAEQYCASGQKEKALPLLDEITESSFGLWSEQRAEELRGTN